MAGYIGNIPVPQATQTRDTFTATAGQTSFATSGYTPNYLDVYLNGVKLAASDYTATNGSDVVLASGATLNDILDVVAYNTFEVADVEKLTYSGADKVNTTSTGIDVTGTVTADGLTVDGAVSVSTVTADADGALGSQSPQFTIFGGNSNNPLEFGMDNSGATSVGFIQSRNTLSGAQYLALNPKGGNVGIGTSSPATPLNIVGTTSSVDIRLKNSNSVSNGMDVGLGSAGTDGYTWLYENGHYRIATNNTERMRIDSSGNVGIGTSSPDSKLHVSNGTSTALDDSRYVIKAEGTTEAYISVAADGYAGIRFPDSSNVSRAYIDYYHSADALVFGNPTERMRIDSSGNLLVGTTTTNVASSSSESGVRMGDGFLQIARASNDILILNRQTTDGDIAVFRKDGTTVGSIASVSGDISIGTGDTKIRFFDSGDQLFPTTDNLTTLGRHDSRWKDLYLSGGVYLGGTGSANYLDDYEEGTFTPYYSPQYGAFGSITYSEQAGAYTKIGDTVIFQIRLRTSSFSIGTASGSIYIHGMPFTSVNNSQWGRNSQSLYANNWGGDTPRATSVEVNTTYAYLFYRSVSNGGDLTIQVGDFSTGGTSNQIWITGSYKAA